MKQITFNNQVYTKDNKTGYYLGAKYPRKRLHRAVWEYYNGEISKGYEIHHKDHIKNNNDISNLQLVTKAEHLRIHSQEMTEEQKEKYRKNLNENARPKAIEWHKSKEGREWHKKQYEVSLGNRKPIKFKCLNCGKEFEAMNTGKNKFCSNNCKSDYRKKTGVDNIERKCTKCGQTFVVNKYSLRKKCYNCSSIKNRKHR